MSSGPQTSDFGVTTLAEHFRFSVTAQAATDSLENRVNRNGNTSSGQTQENGQDRQSKAPLHEFKHGSRLPESLRTRLLEYPCVQLDCV
jgi:hypothetical protein